MATEVLEDSAAEAQKAWVEQMTSVFGGSADVNPAAVMDSPVEETATEKARRERQRALILPREHGAWGLLLVPIVTGAGVAFHQASHIFPLILLLTAALALFCLR